MASRKVDIDNLGAAIVQAVHDYTEDVSRAIAKEVDDTAKQALKDVKAASPRQTGDYHKGWRLKGMSRDGVASRILHNATDYQLVHLLEFGHASRNGGRVSAKPHVKPSVDPLLKRMERNVKDIIEGGGR